MAASWVDDASVCRQEQQKPVVAFSASEMARASTGGEPLAACTASAASRMGARSSRSAFSACAAERDLSCSASAL
eukprot:CAMPEP_0113259494 /NCGR_PEP_ID=MMETSP0008_2-20120614/16381_1 /TAXON_ID=97485 /ORGANISM="Prymnesium parvum" /LENGTH=74 /DNA_ID=CAMNT_0000108015 /DNA_START=8 /DNA_END=229 /DNA_ORIENTATION=+ /assembly_acc=CAM_ASM_000153